MRIAVYGTGGVGGFFGAKLAQAGEEVIFIARGAHLQAIRDNGLTVKSFQGDFTIQPARAESDPAAVGPVDFVVVGVKTWQMPETAQAIRPLIGPNTLVVPLQNGVEASTQLAEGVGAEHVVGGLCRLSCKVAGPGIIQHLGMDPYIAFSHLDGRPDPRLETLRDVFARVNVKAEIPADIQSALWAKFIFIASISGLGAVTRAPIGVVRSLSATRTLLEAAVAEVAAVGRAQGIHLAPTVEQATLKTIDSLPAGTIPSMMRDILDGRPSELESQTGSVVRLGHAGAVPTPVNDFLYACLLPQEELARGRIAF